MTNSSTLVRTTFNTTLVFVIGLSLILYLGKGSRVTKSFVQPVKLMYYQAMRWFNPPQTPLEVGSGKDAKKILLYDPMGIVEDELGNIYVGDRGKKGVQGGFIWKIDNQGHAVVIAGTGQPGKANSGIPARASNLADVQGLSLDSLGRIYFCDSANHVLLRIEHDGMLTKIAGTGEGTFNGDQKRAIRASLNKPFDVRVDPEGNIYIADFGNHRVRKIDQAGIIHTVAGTGEAGYSGDGGLAHRARLNGPYGIFIDQKNRLLIADSRNHVIRRVDERNIISTIAGTGKQGYSGDGGPALESQFNTPQSLFVDHAGQVYVGDEHNSVIRIIDQDHHIFSLVGTGVRSPAIEGLGSRQTTLGDQENMVVRADGSILFTEGDSGRVLKINRSGVVESFAGQGNFALVAP